MDYDKNKVYTFYCVDADYPNLLIALRIESGYIRHMIYTSSEPIVVQAYDKEKCSALPTTPIEIAYALGLLYRRVLRWMRSEVPMSSVLVNNNAFLTFTKANTND
ncbi:MAG: hypothetical protein ACRC6V_01405 [Bacteroidales bacterium]